MGESIVEGTLTKWLKKPGDRVERDEPLFEISTDKVDTEVPSPAAGTLAEVLVQEGQTVPINTVVARIDESGAARVATPREEPAVQAVPPVEAAAPEPAKPAVEAAPEVEEPAAAEAVGPLSPLVRRMLREHNLDPRLIKGTGAGGRITKQDVEAYLAARAQAAAAAAPPETPAAAPPPPPSARPEAPAPPETPPSPPEAAPLPRPEAAKVRIEPMSIMRQKIAEHMIMSRRTSAHVTTIHRVDMTRVARMRERYKAEIQQRYGFSLTYLPFITRAAAQALRAYPLLNASIDRTNIVYHNEINIGIAVALENGLIVPVIRNADEKSVIGLQRAIVDLATRARSRQLKPDEVQGGTFSITNFGSYGSLTGTPIINQPQVAILGVGVVEKAPVVVDDDKIAIRSVCLLSLSFDHRLIDGALADQFMLKIKSVLENWSEEVL
jgi:2-oxoglutarate dehydrogenase E2 component (dihydrolipoamide succinyltransferase)